MSERSDHQQSWDRALRWNIMEKLLDGDLGVDNVMLVRKAQAIERYVITGDEPAGPRKVPSSPKTDRKVPRTPTEGVLGSSMEQNTFKDVETEIRRGYSTLAPESESYIDIAITLVEDEINLRTSRECNTSLHDRTMLAQLRQAIRLLDAVKNDCVRNSVTQERA